MTSKPPRIVELVGVAGAGKTTLAKALSQSSKRIIHGHHPYFRKVEHIPFFAWNTLLMMPTFIHLYASYGIKCLTSREVAWMVILHGWHHVLRRQASNDGSIIVMDQGPVSIMAELSVIDPKCLQSQAAKKWWENTIKGWIDALDLLIWLDASDPTLIKRVRTRDQWHLIKDQQDREALDFNTSYRSTYNSLLSALTADGRGPQVIEINTGRESLDTVMDKVLVALEIKKLDSSIPQ